MHDIVEDGELDVEEIQKQFGYDVSLIVLWLTGVDKNKVKLEKSKYFEIFKKYCDFNWRVPFVKLFDCIDNLETISGLNPEKQQKFIKEKKEIYLPILKNHKNNIPYEMREIYVEKLNDLKTLLQ